MRRVAFLALLSMLGALIFAPGLALANVDTHAGGGGDTASMTASPSPTAAGAAQYQYKKSVTAIPKGKKVLPDTGGGGVSPAALALGAAGLLLASGVVASAMVRRS